MSLQQEANVLLEKLGRKKSDVLYFIFVPQILLKVKANYEIYIEKEKEKERLLNK